MGNGVAISLRTGMACAMPYRKLIILMALLETLHSMRITIRPTSAFILHASMLRTIQLIIFRIVDKINVMTFFGWLLLAHVYYISSSGCLVDVTRIGLDSVSKWNLAIWSFVLGFTSTHILWFCIISSAEYLVDVTRIRLDLISKWNFATWFTKSRKRILMKIAVA